jgi:hypothetical protein
VGIVGGFFQGDRDPGVEYVGGKGRKGVEKTGNTIFDRFRDLGVIDFKYYLWVEKLFLFA